MSEKMTEKMTDEQDKCRIDKWLWAARFFKTRALAVVAVEQGKVLLNGARVKPAKTVAPSDRLDIRHGEVRYVVDIIALSNKRGGAPDAQKLYLETDESRTLRAENSARLKAEPARFLFKGRPTKRDRRIIEKHRRGGDE